MEFDALADRFGASRAEPVHVGFSAAVVVRLHRGPEVLFHKEGPGVSEEADRLTWLGGTGFPCPRVLDRGDDWMLSTSLPGRDASQPWPAADRPAVLTALAEGLEAHHSLTDSPYVDVALMVKSLSGELNPQYGGPPAARAFAKTYGADPGDPRIKLYIDLDDSGAY